MKLSLKNLRYSFKSMFIVIKDKPIFLFAYIFKIITQVIMTMIPIGLVDKIVEAYKNGKEFKDIILIILINTIIILLSSLVESLLNTIIMFCKNRFTLVFNIELYKKLKTIDYKFQTSPEFLDNYTWALDMGATNIYNVANQQMLLIIYIVKSIFVFSVIFTVSSIAVGYALLVAIIYIFIRRKVSEINFKINEMIRPKNRVEWGISRVYMVKDSIPDIKTTALNDVMIYELEKSTKEKIEILEKHDTKRTRYATIGRVIINTIFPVVLLFVCIEIIKTKDSSRLASISLATTMIYNIVFEFVEILTTIQIEANESKVTFEVLEMDSIIEKDEGLDINNFEKIEVKNIDFSYTDKKVLDNVSFEINKGERIAILGVNGAGKTTLVKMLLRLYDVDGGAIIYNGINYKEINVRKLRQKIGAMFQNVELYSDSIAENILLRKVQSKEDEEKVIDALNKVGLYDIVSKSKNGIYTTVTREFDGNGIVFSGGQMQKLVLARTYAQDYELLILDEPSSKLDPLAETEMYNNMLKMGKGKTIIFISHRLSAAVNCDKILVFDKGKLIEYGKHDDLIKIENGKYKEMFFSQAEKYIGDKNV